MAQVSSASCLKRGGVAIKLFSSGQLLPGCDNLSARCAPCDSPGAWLYGDHANLPDRATLWVRQHDGYDPQFGVRKRQTAGHASREQCRVVKQAMLDGRQSCSLRIAGSG